VDTSTVERYITVASYLFPPSQPPPLYLSSWVWRVAKSHLLIARWPPRAPMMSRLATLLVVAGLHQIRYSQSEPIKIDSVDGGISKEPPLLFSGLGANINVASSPAHCLPQSASEKARPSTQDCGKGRNSKGRSSKGRKSKDFICYLSGRSISDIGIALETLLAWSNPRSEKPTSFEWRDIALRAFSFERNTTSLRTQLKIRQDLSWGFMSFSAHQREPTKCLDPWITKSHSHTRFYKTTAAVIPEPRKPVYAPVRAVNGLSDCSRRAKWLQKRVPLPLVNIPRKVVSLEYVVCGDVTVLAEV